MCPFKDSSKFGEPNLSILVNSVTSQQAAVVISGLFGIQKKFSRMQSKFLGEFSEFPMGHACMSLLFNIEQHFVVWNLGIMVNSVGSQQVSRVVSLLFKIEQGFNELKHCFSVNSVSSQQPALVRCVLLKIYQNLVSRI